MENNKYVSTCTSNKKKDINSLSYLVDIPLSQSDCIKLGTGLERILKDFIIYNSELEDIRPKIAIKGKKEKDHLFKNEKKKTIIYAEIKGNLNLDTEKSPATYNKCRDIENELKTMYTDYNIKMYLVNVRYYTKNAMPINIKNKFKSIIDNLLGVNEYLNVLELNDTFINENDYKIFINLLAELMFKN